jgi:hypothetical protein
MKNEKITIELFPQALTIVFITLKLCGIIHWSWWWVLAPIWGAVLVAFSLLAIAAYIKK